MLVDMEHEGLVVFPTHRIVRDLESFDAEKAEKLCEEYFYVEKKILKTIGITRYDEELD